MNGCSTPWYRQREKGSFYFFRFLSFLLSQLGRRWCKFLILPITVCIWVFDTSGRTASLRFLDQCDAFQNIHRTRVAQFIRSLKHFFEFGQSLIDKGAVWSGEIIQEDVTFHGIEVLRNLTSQRIGVMLFGSHLGNIEVLRGLAHKLPTIRVTALMHTQQTPAFQKILTERNPKFEERVISTDSTGPDTIIQIQAALERGEALSLLADRVMPGSAAKSVETNFLGRRAKFPAGPFVLASLASSPIFLIFCFRVANGYEVYVEKLFEELKLPRKTREAALKEAVERYATRLEHYASRYPLQWFNFFDFWG